MTTNTTTLAETIATMQKVSLARYEQASDACAAAAGQGHGAERVAELAFARHEAELTLNHWNEAANLGAAEALGRGIRHLADDGSRWTDPLRNDISRRERIVARRFVALLSGMILGHEGADQAAAGSAVLNALSRL